MPVPPCSSWPSLQLELLLLFIPIVEGALLREEVAQERSRTLWDHSSWCSKSWSPSFKTIHYRTSHCSQELRQPASHRTLSWPSSSLTDRAQLALDSVRVAKDSSQPTIDMASLACLTDASGYVAHLAAISGCLAPDSAWLAPSHPNAACPDP